MTPWSQRIIKGFDLKVLEKAKALKCMTFVVPTYATGVTVPLTEMIQVFLILKIVGQKRLISVSSFYFA
tara:strand:+ start:6509 stop:6715 length:207 start_codon:yes stop_codon:yes gene_type:complete